MEVQIWLFHIHFLISLWITRPCSTLTSSWTDYGLGCIRGHDEEEKWFVSSMDDCKIRCEQATAFVCQSVEYNPSSYICYMASVTKDETSEEYISPCPWPLSEVRYAGRSK